MDNYIHSYIDNDVGFRYIPLSDGYYPVNIVIESTDATKRSKIKNALRLFHTQEVYNAHVLFELQDIMGLVNVNNQDYKEPLIHNTIRDLGVTMMPTECFLELSSKRICFLIDLFPNLKRIYQND